MESGKQRSGMTVAERLRRLMAGPYQPVIKKAGQAYVDRDDDKKYTHIAQFRPKPLAYSISLMFGRRLQVIEFRFRRHILHWKKQKVGQ